MNIVVIKRFVRAYSYVAMVTPLQVAYEVPSGHGWDILDAVVDTMSVLYSSH